MAVIGNYSFGSLNPSQYELLWHISREGLFNKIRFVKVRIAMT